MRWKVHEIIIATFALVSKLKPLHASPQIGKHLLLLIPKFLATPTKIKANNI